MPTKKDPFKGLEVLPHRATGDTSLSATRAVKVMRPMCKECQLEFRNGRGWWKICDSRGHDPYYRKTEEIVKVPVREERDGRVMVTGYEEIINTTKRPNLKAVNVHIRVNSGRSLEKGIVNRGYRPLTDFGYHPMCEMSKCEAPSKIDTRYGRYCKERHARLVGANVEERALPVNDVKALREVLDSVNIYGD